MSDNTDYGFDLDSILAEFSSDSGTQDTEIGRASCRERVFRAV